MRRGSVERSPAARAKADAAFAGGATVDEATRAIRADGHAVSRSSVGRYRAKLEKWLQVKRENDALVKALAGDAPERSGLMNLARNAALHLLSRAADGDFAPEDAHKLAATLLSVERAEDLAARREERAREAERRHLEERARGELDGLVPAEKLDAVLKRIYGLS